MRCPIYACKHFKGCGVCKTLKTFCPYPDLKVITQDTKNLSKILDSCKSKEIPICFVTNTEVPRELIWDISYLPHNTLQINICMFQEFKKLKWVGETVHLTETCGIRCNIVLYPIIPSVITTVDVLKLIDTLRNCEHCKLYLKFAELYLSNPKFVQDNLIIDNYKIPVRNMEQFNEYLWKCNSFFSEDFFKMIKFYTDGANIPLISI